MGTEPNPLPQRLYKDDAQVYVLVEEARLRCEALRRMASTEESQRELRRLHRDLGLSGLHASTKLPAPARRALLARVHARTDSVACSGPGARRGLVRTVRRAKRAMARSLARNGRADHIELAQLHLFRAMEFLLPAGKHGFAVAHPFRRHELRRVFAHEHTKSVT